MILVETCKANEFAFSYTRCHLPPVVPAACRRSHDAPSWRLSREACVGELRAAISPIYMRL